MPHEHTHGEEACRDGKAPAAARPEAGAARLPALVRALTDPDGRVRLVAALTVWQISGEARTIAPVLLRALRDRCPHTVLAALSAAVGPALVPKLMRALQDPDARVRAAAACALGYVRPEAGSGLPGLVQALPGGVADEAGGAKHGPVSQGSVRPTAVD
jgi:HEAT repeat protein